MTFQLSEDGTTTELLTAVTEKLSEIATPGTVTETGPLDFAPIIKHLETTPLFQYQGSLTTPPCAEGLTFLVTKEPLPLNVKTYNAIKSVVKFNSRYTQNSLGEENLVGVGSKALAAASSQADPAAPGAPGAVPAGGVYFLTISLIIEHGLMFAIAVGKNSSVIAGVVPTATGMRCIMGACHTPRVINIEHA